MGLRRADVPWSIATREAIRFRDEADTDISIAEQVAQISFELDEFHRADSSVSRSDVKEY